jgi:SPP1 family predicted phage head-tail adaptor
MLRWRVTVERLTLTPDGAGGGAVQTWDTLYRPWAYIAPVTNGEKLFGMQLESPITHILYIRFNTQISVRDRIIHRGRTLNIKSIADIEEKKTFMELRCEEVRPDPPGVAT